MYISLHSRGSVWCVQDMMDSLKGTKTKEAWPPPQNKGFELHNITSQVHLTCCLFSLVSAALVGRVTNS